MSVLKQVVLLSLLGATVSTEPDDCEALNKRLPTTDLSKIFGKWVLVWSVSDADEGSKILEDTISHHVEMKLLPDNKTVEFFERNLYSTNTSSCIAFLINMTVIPDSEHLTLHIGDTIMYVDGVAQHYNETGEVDFYETCPDCLQLVFKELNGFVMSYRREGSHQDVDDLKTDHDHLKKRAECLKFPTERPFSYDGTADFCHKRSAADVKPEES